MYDIIIIGAGPAGLTSAIYGERAGKKTLVLESLSYGGKIINALLVKNYPGIKEISGFDFATNLYEQAIELGSQIKYEKVIGIKDNGESKFVITNENEYECMAIIIATGVQNRKLLLDREDELLGKGISYCATCDGAFYKDKVCAVVGGGNVSIDDALFLSNYCKKVYVIYRKEKLRAESILVDRLKTKDNVEFIYNSNVIKLNGKDKLESIDILNNVTNERNNLIIDGLFIAIGQVPDNRAFSNLVKLDDNGYIITDNECHTNIKGIYAAGDTRVKSIRQLTTASSDGTIAALTAVKEMF